MGARRALMDDAVRHLAAIERGSASPGEREAAEWIATRLRKARVHVLRHVAAPRHRAAKKPPSPTYAGNYLLDLSGRRR